MHIQLKTIEKLQNLIAEETTYRSGPKLVSFFNELGFNDIYGQGFPSRGYYVEQKLKQINGTPELDKCIKNLFSPVNFIPNIDILDKHITDFNQYLAFDGWKVVRTGKDISISKVRDNYFEKIQTSENKDIKEDDFLNNEFKEIDISKLELDGVITDVLTSRISEIKKCLNIKASLSVIFLAGSSLEGILLGIASKYPKEFNQSKCAPKEKDDNNKVLQFHRWTLNDFINVSYELGFIREDVKKFSHSLRDFRNYIHPYEQMNNRFTPDEHTAKICFQVLKAAIFQICNNK